MWGNTPVYDFSGKSLVRISPVRLRSGLTGTLAAQPPQTLSSEGTGCHDGFHQGCSRQTLEQMTQGRAGPTCSLLPDR